MTLPPDKPLLQSRKKAEEKPADQKPKRKKLIRFFFKAGDDFVELDARVKAMCGLDANPPNPPDHKA